MSDRKFRTLLPNTDRRPQSRERNEELRVIRGTRGVPGTVAPFRAWRGSRDLVAQSPKFHAPAVAPHFVQPFRATADENSNTAPQARPKCAALAAFALVETTAEFSGRINKIKYSTSGRIFLLVLPGNAGSASASGTPHDTGPSCTHSAGRRTLNESSSYFVSFASRRVSRRTGNLGAAPPAFAGNADSSPTTH